jgi:hypothetical protein
MDYLYAALCAPTQKFQFEYTEILVEDLIEAELQHKNIAKAKRRSLKYAITV